MEWSKQKTVLSPTHKKYSWFSNYEQWTIKKIIIKKNYLNKSDPVLKIEIMIISVKNKLRLNLNIRQVAIVAPYVAKTCCETSSWLVGHT